MPCRDVVIVGAGPAGLALAGLLAADGQQVALVDARAREAADSDPRAFALAYGTRLTLERLGAWEGLPATPIETIHVSQEGGFGRTLLRAAELDVPALGYVTQAGALTQTLRRRAEQAGAMLLPETAMLEHQVQADRVCMHLRSEFTAETRIDARLLVRAEGTDRNARDVRRRDYAQHALIATVRARGGHGHTAFERFTREGPLALLPFGRDEYSLVHVMRPEQAEKALRLEDEAYLARLHEHLRGRLKFEHIGHRNSFPLGLQYRPAPVAARTAWIGNAAQTLHPVAGQGFNLALRDVWALAEAVRESPSDPGRPPVLSAYAGSRRLDRCGTIAFTDTIVRLFSNDFGPLRQLRGTALFKLDTSPPLRSFLARRMMFGARAWP